MKIESLKIFIALFLFLQPIQFAQEFTASVNETTVAANERFQVSFVFSGKSINNLKNFKPPSFSNFLVLSGPNQSTSIQIINGVQTASLTYLYILQPEKVGTYSISKAIIEQNGQTYETKSLKMQVVKGSAKPKQNNTKQTISNEEIAKNLYIRAIIDKRKVYKGEQVTVVYKLYTRLTIASQMSINKLPQYQGFWAEELETASNITFNTKVINGKQFRVGVLKKVALFPSQTGKLEVTPFELTVPVQIQRKRSRNIFDDFFGDPFGRGETIEYKAVSNTVKVDVLPLPIEGKPENFHGAVGDFKLEATMNKTSTKTNEPLTLNVSISGTGNFELLEMPEINLPTGFEKYEPKVTENVRNIGKLRGSKRGEYLFVPRVVGIREIPPIEFSYFDPVKKKYFTLKSEPFILNIEQGDRIVNTEVVGKEDVQQLGNDIRFIKTSFSGIEKKSNYMINTNGFWIAGAAPFLLLAVLLGWKRRSDKLAGNVALLRYQKAQKVAKNRLKKAGKFLQEKNHKEFYTELSLALFGYLEDKLHIPKAEFTVERAVDDLRMKGVQEGLITDLKNSAEKCEYVRFAPGAEESAAMKEMYDELAEVIISLEKSIVETKNA
jgi:hypothetical protein